MTSENANKRIEEIRNEKPQWTNKQVVIQAIGEIIQEKDGFIDSFLLTENFDSEAIGVLWLSEEIDYIPPQTLEILGKNGLGIKKSNLNRSNQIKFC